MEFLTEIVFVGEKNGDFSFLVKLISKLVCLANVIVLNVFFYKSLNAGIANYGTMDLNLIRLLLFKIVAFDF